MRLAPFGLSPVRSLEEKLHGARLEPGASEDIRQRHAAPDAKADRTRAPWLARRKRSKSNAIIACTFHRRLQRSAGHRRELRERELHGPVKATIESQPPSLGVEDRVAEVAPNVKLRRRRGHNG
jgi:hypothetical protein